MFGKGDGVVRRVKVLVKRRVLPNEPVVMTVAFGVGRGIRLRLHPQHHLRMWLGLYELELDRHIRRLVRAGARCYDVGGQLGYDALVFAKVSGGEVTSFEADSEWCSQLPEMFALNPHLAPRLAAVQAYVGRGDDSSLSLDDYAGSEPPDLIKIDVDGGEFDVLCGARQILRDRRPALIVETHSAHLEELCGRMLVQHGYRPRIVHQRRILPDLRPLAHNRWLVAP